MEIYLSVFLFTLPFLPFHFSTTLTTKATPRSPSLCRNNNFVDGRTGWGSFACPGLREQRGGGFERQRRR